MKNLAAQVLFILAVSSFVPGTMLPSQDAPAQSLPPSLYLMADIQVEVAKAPDYEASLKAMIAALKDARFADVSGAGHMVAGDRNDAFSGAVLEFLRAEVPR